jgi:hypothetical protein
MDSKVYIQNKYTKAYYRIIQKALTEKPEGYTETHHIVPRCLGGTNSKHNLVRLSLKQHRVCHRLLTKMVHYNDTKTDRRIRKGLIVALNGFLNKGRGSQPTP